MVSKNLFAGADKLLHTLMQTMLDTLIQSKTRLKLLLRFFLNPESSAYLRGLAQEFDESTNAVRVELNRFEEAGLIQSHKDGNKKMYQVNTNFPMFNELQKIAFKHFGIDQIIEQVIEKLGDVEAVYLTGDLARGLDSKVVDVTLVGNGIDEIFLTKLCQKAETMITRKISAIVYSSNEEYKIENPNFLIFGEIN